jgi:predicted nucleic acid-binding protein
MVLIDTNVLLDIATRDPQWFAWSSSKLGRLVNRRQAAINPVIYTELAHCFHDERELDLNLLPPADFKRLPLPYAVAFPAARAYAAYRRAGGTRTAPLPDFFIGAHAEAAGLAILTRDPIRYRTYFPTVKLIAPP